MPNWCENTVTILANDEETLQSILEKYSSDDSNLSFDKVLPLPGGEWDYDLAVSTWGTKWHVNMVNYQIINNYDTFALVYSFDTAWSPSIPVTEEIARQNPELTISHSWDEPGMDFGGFVVFRGTEMISAMEGRSKAHTWDELAQYAIDY